MLPASVLMYGSLRCTKQFFNIGSSNHVNEAAKYQNSRNMDLHDYTCSSHGRLQLFGFALQEIPTSVRPAVDTNTPLQDSLMPIMVWSFVCSSQSQKPMITLTYDMFVKWFMRSSQSFHTPALP